MSSHQKKSHYRKKAAAGLLATVISIASALPALAGYNNVQVVRVVEIAGGQTIEIRRHPFDLSGLVGRLPFNARGIEAALSPNKRWIKISYQSPSGYSVTGWARSANFADDDQVQPTQYHLVGVDNSEVLEVFRQPTENSRIAGYLPAEADGIVAGDDCRKGWCAIQYGKGGKAVRGFVQAGYLAVTAQDHYPAAVSYVDPGSYVVRKHKKDGWSYDPNKVYMDPAPNAAENIMPDSYDSPGAYDSNAYDSGAPKQGWVRRYRPFSNGVTIQGGNPDSFSLDSSN